MNHQEEVLNELLKGPEYFLGNVSVDNVIFGYHRKELKVLLLRPKGLPSWTVCGGYIRKTESIDEAAKRVAGERTGLDKLYLKQFSAFGNPGRTGDVTNHIEHICNRTGVNADNLKWMTGYFVSIGYYTLTEFDLVKPTGEYYCEECQWWNIQNLPPLMSDHKLIILEALKSLRLDINHYPIGYELLPEKFTLPEIITLYETILEKKLDDRNFAKKLLATGIIAKLNETRNIGPHRSPFLYVFNKEKYEESLRTGIVLAI